MALLLDQLQQVGCTLALDENNTLLAESDTPLTEVQRTFIRANKQRLIAEIARLSRFSEPRPRCGNRRWDYQHGCWAGESA